MHEGIHVTADGIGLNAVTSTRVYAWVISLYQSMLLL